MQRKSKVSVKYTFSILLYYLFCQFAEVLNNPYSSSVTSYSSSYRQPPSNTNSKKSSAIVGHNTTSLYNDDDVGCNETNSNEFCKRSNQKYCSETDVSEEMIETFSEDHQLLDGGNSISNMI